MSDLNKQDTKNTNEVSQNWFASWFDTAYYHILYKDRNYREAQVFMDTLTQYLNLPEKAKVLDLACGKGRHSIYLNQLGFDVIGADLSENSIKSAKNNENETLHFELHDMREVMSCKFDAIFNLFTSFGYFENEEDNLTTLIAIKNSLTDYGFAVIDFMNVQHVIANLVAKEIKTVDGIEFHISRFHDEKYIYKEISFTDKGEDFKFTERVRALTLQNFTDMMAEAEINLLDIFGDYKLKKFHKTDSERLIMIFK
jgi:SAM-dependent methyltransferase